MGMMHGMLLVLVLVSLVIHPIVKRLGRRTFFGLAVLLAAMCAALVQLSIPVFGGGVRMETMEWIPQLGLTLSLRLDPLSAVFALLVTGAGALVLWYCASYFDEGEQGLPRFTAVFLGFIASMLALVLADDVYALFIGWEATTVFSFLLIGHVTRLRTATAAALQALIVTSLGGLAMLVGFVLLASEAGTSSVSAIVANPPEGALVTTAIYLVLAGALSKSAIFPFHFWLPGAMAAPTPVSAYLHAAAMVKAGIYLIARIMPGFGDVPGVQWTLIVLGAITMMSAGVRALRQTDLKLILAHGTVSQLGMLVMVLGLAEPRAMYAGLALMLAHAIAKAPLFLTVGIIDHSTGTRDLRKLCGLGRRLPVLAAIATIAACSMAGVPPLFGFVAKESGLTETLHLTSIGTMSDRGLAWIVLATLVIGSTLTVAYMGRFLWGAFALKPNAEVCAIVHRPPAMILVAPAVFALGAIAAGVAPTLIDQGLFAVIRPVRESEAPEHLALWHGVTPALFISVAILAAGLALVLLLARALRNPEARAKVRAREQRRERSVDRFSGSHMYWVLTHWVDLAAVKITSLTQRGSLPFYLSVILGVVVISLTTSLLVQPAAVPEVQLAQLPEEWPIGLIMIAATVVAIRARTRFQSVILVGVTGYGMAAIFATHGAPDLALTQVLVETMTLIAFVLVIRRLPQRLPARAPRGRRIVRLVIGAGVGLVTGLVAIIALGSRVAEPISLALPELAYTGGHGTNVVNVMLVDIRGWDTLGELSVILAAATGVASLVFVNTRADERPMLSRRDARAQAREHLARVVDPNDPMRRVSWVLAGRHLDQNNRSILLEVMVRIIFHALIILSFYLLLAGHNAPGGGFAGGLVAGLALVARYLAGGRIELGATVPLDAGRILGIGLALSVTMAVLPMFFGQAPLSSSWVDLDLGAFGTLPLVSSTLFDIGVYLVVFGLVLDVLRSLGAEIDQHERSDRALSDTSTVEEVSTR